jgi:hypothetical protein
MTSFHLRSASVVAALALRERATLPPKRTENLYSFLMLTFRNITGSLCPAKPK